LIATGGTSAASTTFTIVASAALSGVTNPGYVGEQLTITGTGFKADTRVYVIFHDESIPIASTVTSNNGRFESGFNVPRMDAGSHTIKVSDGTNSKSFAFYMESDAPEAPQRLLPQDGSNLTLPITFDWDDVTDNSLPVTYELQVTTDAAYANIILEKTSLTMSGYTTTEDDLLLLTSGAPYYWRIRAVDAAGYGGDWSLSGAFYII